MSNRSRQLTGGRLAVEMSKLGHALARLHLGGAALPVFMQKTGNESSLSKENDASQHNLPAVLFPGSWFAKENPDFPEGDDSC